MKVTSPILFIKFNIKEIFIFVGKENDNGSFDLLEMVTLTAENFYENRSYNFLKNGSSKVSSRRIQICNDFFPSKSN